MIYGTGSTPIGWGHGMTDTTESISLYVRFGVAPQHPPAAPWYASHWPWLVAFALLAVALWWFSRIEEVQFHRPRGQKGMIDA